MNYKATVSYKEQFTENIINIKFKLVDPPEMEFKAGQFISVSVSDTVKRMYSIASPPKTKDEIEVVVDTRPGGPGSHFFQNIQVGDEVEIMGPLGQFNIKEPADKPIFLACTGTGIAPFRSMIYDLLEKGFDKDIHLFFGLRYEQDQFYVDELRKLEEQYPNFHLTLTLSRPTEQWQGKSGYITKWMGEIPNEQFVCDVYICGWKEVVDSVVEVCKQKGLTDDCIHFENYG